MAWKWSIFEKLSLHQNDEFIENDHIITILSILIISSATLSRSSMVYHLCCFPPNRSFLKFLTPCHQLFSFSLQITDLLVNITKHILMPKHEILTAFEKQKLLKKYKAEDKQVIFFFQTWPLWNNHLQKKLNSYYWLAFTFM